MALIINFLFLNCLKTHYLWTGKLGIVIFASLFWFLIIFNSSGGKEVTSKSKICFVHH